MQCRGIHQSLPPWPHACHTFLAIIPQKGNDAFLDRNKGVLRRHSTKHVHSHAEICLCRRVQVANRPYYVSDGCMGQLRVRNKVRLQPPGRRERVERASRSRTRLPQGPKEPKGSPHCYTLQPQGLTPNTIAFSSQAHLRPTLHSGSP